MRSRWLSPSVVTSVLLITIGVLFLLDNLNILPVGDVWRFWPLILIFSGVSKLTDRDRPSSLIWGSFLVLCGAGWLANNLHWWNFNFHAIWPLTLIMVGVMMLVKALDSAQSRKGWTGAFTAGTIREHVVFSGTKRKLDTPNFEGGEIVCIFGGVELNLRKCGMTGGQAVIDVAITFGGVEIKIPEGWRVVNQCMAVFGACEDKTLAPRPESGVQAPVLVITGHALFGAVNVEN